MGGAGPIGAKLRAIREKAGVSLGDLALRMERSKSTVQTMFDTSYRDRETDFLDVQDALELVPALTKDLSPELAKEIQAEVLDLTGFNLLLEIRGEDGPEPLSPEVSAAVAEALGRIALGGRAPSEDALAAMTRTLQGLTEVYATDAGVRRDPAETRGALRVLMRQAEPQRLPRLSN